MRPQTFEFSKKYGFSQITFFRKVGKTNIHSESFLKFDSAHFGILIDIYKKKKIFSKIFFFTNKIFFLTYGKIFLLLDQSRACSKMKKAQWGFSFTKFNIHILKQLCLYFNYMTLTV